MSKDSALIKLKLPEILPIGTEKYQYLEEVWENEKMQTFKDVFW